MGTRARPARCDSTEMRSEQARNEGFVLTSLSEPSREGEDGVLYLALPSARAAPRYTTHQLGKDHTLALASETDRMFYD